MEIGETLQQAAARECMEEALAEVGIAGPCAIVHVLHAEQVHVMFRARLADPAYGVGAESLETLLTLERFSVETAPTATEGLKKLETTGYLRRQRDPTDERQVRVSLTDAGRGLREKLGARNLVKASGLSPEEFPKLQKAVVTLRNNLIKSMRDVPTDAAASPSPAATEPA